MSEDFYSLPYLEQIHRLEQLARQALSFWPIQIRSIELVKYRENGVFKVQAKSGRFYALRIHRPGYHEQAAIISELQWMAALGESGLDIPRVVPNKSGELFVMARTQQVPEARLIDLFEWVEGETIRVRLEQEIAANNRNGIAHLFGLMGRLMAQLHNHAEVWKAPAGFRRHAWDLDGLVGEQPFWGRFWELEWLSDEQKELMVATRQRLKRDLEDYGTDPATYGLIHADLNFDNVLIDGDQVQAIDFDDAGYGWHLFDMTVTLNHVVGSDLEPLATQGLVAGYRQYRPLLDAELVHLPLFMLIRACTYLGWMRDRQEVEEIRARGPVLIERACKLATAYLDK